MKLNHTHFLVLNQAIKTYGDQSQIEMMIEECAELIQALQKLKRKDTEEVRDHICEELADVELVIFQMRQVFNSDRIDDWQVIKVDRLKERLLKSK
jgi:NTP pyrophosphatase (non-canonical NTP hydrolase)